MKITRKQLKKIIKEEMERFMVDYGLAKQEEPYDSGMDPYEPGIEPEEQADLAPPASGGYVYEPQKMHAAIKSAFAQPMKRGK